MNCTRRCHAPTFCSWAEWGPWSGCSRPCGSAVKSRTRWLHSGTVEPAAAVKQERTRTTVRQLQAKYAALERREREGQSRRLQELAACFAGGLLSLTVFLVAGRAASRRLPVDAVASFSRRALSALSRQAASSLQSRQGPGGHEYVAVTTELEEHDGI